MTYTERRRALIIDLLSRNQVQSQEQLRALLEVEGVATTQSTLSRDLREIGVFKTEEGYQAPALGLDAAERRSELLKVIREAVASVDRGHNIVVLQVRPAEEQRVSKAISDANLPDALGTTIGQGSVWVATRTATQAKALHGQLQSMMR